MNRLPRTTRGALLAASNTATASSASTSSAPSLPGIRRCCGVLAPRPHSEHPDVMQRRSYRSYVRIRAPAPPPQKSSASPSSSSSSPSSSSSARVPLTTSVYGHATSRGTRPYQEDASSVSCITLSPEQLRKSLKRGGRIAAEAERRWKWESQQGSSGGSDAARSLDEEIASQVMWWGVYDGHGGDHVSKYLALYLHQIFEKVTEDMVTDTVQNAREHGGYFRRFVGGALERWVRKEELKAVRGGAARGMRKKENASAVSSEDNGAEDESVSPVTSEQVGEDESTGGGASEADRIAEGKQPKHAADITPPKKAEATKEVGTNPSIFSKANSSAPVWEDDGLTKSIPPPDGMENETLTLSERATLAFLVADRHILARKPQDGCPIEAFQSKESTSSASSEKRGIRLSKAFDRSAASKETTGGSTTSVVVLQSLDSPPTIWYDSSLLLLNVYHVGDTRVLLCPVSNGLVTPLTSFHHPDSPSESDRLRKLGAGVVTDSFGEARWMGALANTRALGDGNFKAAGVTPEPEIISQVIRGEAYSHLVLFSDGISSVMSDQEVLDLCRGCDHPNQAAKRILDFAEELGVEDNSTVLVVPLKGWGKVGGTDTTEKQRDYRRSKVDVFRDNRQ